MESWHFKLVLVAAISGGAGWSGHALFFGSERGGKGRPTETAQTAQTVEYREIDCAPTRPMDLDGRSDRSEVYCGDLQRDLEAALREVEACHSDEVPWPSEINDAFRADGFEKAVSQSLQEVGIDGDVLFYCSEFPCVAQLPESSDHFAVQQSLERMYGEDAEVFVRGHSTVGGWGARALRFVSVMPKAYADDYVKERVHDRTEDLIQETQKALRAEVKTKERQDGN